MCNMPKQTHTENQPSDFKTGPRYMQFLLTSCLAKSFHYNICFPLGILISEPCNAPNQKVKCNIEFHIFKQLLTFFLIHENPILCPESQI